ncbi:protein of unknown function [Streptomyces sp. KY75]|nr:protein of unknown function [Streptomyces sp. KY75]CAD5993348.1 protein of unknown function [Streptomyces sp. KY70]
MGTASRGENRHSGSAHSSYGPMTGSLSRVAHAGLALSDAARPARRENCRKDEEEAA